MAMRIMRVVKDLSRTETKESELVAAVAPVQRHWQYDPTRRAPEVIRVADSDLQFAALTQRLRGNEPRYAARAKKQSYCGPLHESFDVSSFSTRGKQRSWLPVLVKGIDALFVNIGQRRPLDQCA